MGMLSRGTDEARHRVYGGAIHDNYCVQRCGGLGTLLGCGGGVMFFSVSSVVVALSLRTVIYVHAIYKGCYYISNGEVPVSDGRLRYLSTTSIVVMSIRMQDSQTLLTKKPFGLQGFSVHRCTVGGYDVFPYGAICGSLDRLVRRLDIRGGWSCNPIRLR